MATEKISVTLSKKLARWARRSATSRRMTLSTLVAEALELRRQHQARESFLDEALAGIPKREIAQRTAQAYREIFGRSHVEP